MRVCCFFKKVGENCEERAGGGCPALDKFFGEER